MPVNVLPLLDTPEQTIDEVASSDEMNAGERTSVWVSELISDVSDSGRLDHMEEECRSSEGHGSAPGSVRLTDIPVEESVDTDPRAVDSDVGRGGTGSDSQRMDSDSRCCDSNPVHLPTLT